MNVWTMEAGDNDDHISTGPLLPSVMGRSELAKGCCPFTKHSPLVCLMLFSADSKNLTTMLFRLFFISRSKWKRSLLIPLKVTCVASSSSMLFFHLWRRYSNLEWNVVLGNSPLTGTSVDRSDLKFISVIWSLSCDQWAKLLDALAMNITIVLQSNPL